MSSPNTSITSYPVVLPAAPVEGQQATTKTYVDEKDATKAALTGDTFTGPVVLTGPFTSANQAVPKSYVDSLGTPDAAAVVSTPTGDVAATNVQGAIAELADEKVAKHGDSMTGALLLAVSTPTQSLEAASKGYVDTMGSVEFSFLPADFTWNPGTNLYTVVINHTLNRRPKVTIYDTTGVEIMGDITYNTVGVNALAVSLRINPTVKVLLT